MTIHSFKRMIVPIALSLIAISWSYFALLPRAAPAANLFEVEALAPASGGALRRLGGARIAWVQIKETLPETIANKTGIHAAIGEVERLLREGEPRQAMVLSEVLALDLATARWAGSTEGLLSPWNALFPSAGRADVTQIDLDDLDGVLERLLRTPEYAAAQSKLDALFIERIWRSRYELLGSDKAVQGYESFEDMLEDFSLALGLETKFLVWFPTAAREIFRKPAPVTVVVSGLSTVGWLMTALEELHPRLKDISWRLRVDGKIPKLAKEVIHAHQRLYVVLPRSA